ncbi:hypothetical protein ACIDI_92c00130 [Acidiphilium sp. JA12-A1]|nr:hypothetical protein ACIDI_92c00130 [Acidiphilium sp. JA12-A1]GBQ04707.1 hypothetical protein AA700_0757 [Acidiphilium acidophilum DSM 700]
MHNGTVCRYGVIGENNLFVLNPMAPAKVMHYPIAHILKTIGRAIRRRRHCTATGATGYRLHAQMVDRHSTPTLPRTELRSNS